MNCYDCGRPYGDKYGFPDLVIPTETWKEISPKGRSEGGLLCPSCICRRLHEAGKKEVPAAFMSGPIKSMDRDCMAALSWTENLRDEYEQLAYRVAELERDQQHRDTELVEQVEKL